MSSGKRKLSLIGKLSETRRLSESHGADAGPDLDQEMEKVFQMDGDKFDLSKISESPDSANLGRRAPLDEVSHHRIKSYPHMHSSLKSLHGRSAKRLVSPRPSVSEEVVPIKKDEIQTDSNPVTILITEGSADEESDKNPTVAGGDGSGSDYEAQRSERAALYHENTLTSDSYRRVQFQIGDIPEDTSPLEGDGEGNDTVSPEEGTGKERNNDVAKESRRGSKEENAEKRKRKHRHYHHHHHHGSRHRKLSLQDEFVTRKRAGSDFSPSEIQRRSSVRPEETGFLDEVDIENLESRRFDDLRRYPKLPSRSTNVSVIHIGRKDGEPLPQIAGPTDKKLIDHSPHEVFVQLDELCGAGDEREWKETARWIKYEEDVEEGADRWGQPHVASLSFHSLLNLRRCLETGVVLLDLDEKDLPGVSYRIVEQMVIDELIDDTDRATVLRALLLRHRHVNEHDRFRFPMRRNFSSYTSLQNLQNYGKQPRIVPSVGSDISATGKKASNGDSPHHTIDLKEEQTYLSSSEDLRRGTKESILKKIPVGAEATTVLVGAVEFLEQPTIAFVRLAEGVLMPSITEVSIPVRFVFVLLGPPQADLDYHEIGRSISTLMSNAQFHNIAYKANDRKDLLSAINEFLDDSIVLPPGDWERKALLPFSELKAKSDAIRRRKNERLNKTLIKQPDDAKKALLAGEDGGDGKKPPYDDPLRRTKRPFGGLVNDLKRRYPYYLTDFMDGCNFQCMAAAIFMYFAALSGAITFGGLLGDKTHNLIGISETLVATCLGGVFFAIFSGQPLVIVGATGPLLLFDESLFGFCESNGIDFLKMRVYIGLWLTVIAIIVVGLEGSVLVKMFTRFTEEIFAALISLLFIFESLQKLVLTYFKHPLLDLETYCDIQNDGAIGVLSENSSHSVPFSLDYVDDSNYTTNNTFPSTSFRQEGGPKNQPNTALFCTILAIGTFFIAYYLRQFRNSKFLGRSARRALGDFGVPLAIIIMVSLDYVTPNTYTEKLQVPEGLEPSNANVRGWIIQPQGLETWVAFAAGVPALLVYILMFMETHITELIIDKKERKLRKGSGFHVDIVLVSIVNAGCGLLGAPWVSAATVRSIAHVSALTVMSRTHAPGDSPHIVEVKEQRLSALLVAVMIGLSVLMSSLLRLVPMAVLFGIFLYMGISSTNGIQFFERLKLFFMPVKHHSQACYVRRVKTFKMHLFTTIQLLCLVVLWVVKSTRISLAFPFFLLLLVPLRAQMRFLFTPQELRALDSDEVELDADNLEDEPDFYTEAPLPG